MLSRVNREGGEKINKSSLTFFYLLLFQLSLAHIQTDSQILVQLIKKSKKFQEPNMFYESYLIELRNIYPI